MIFFSIGLPSRFTDLCDAIALQLAQQRLGRAVVAAINTLEELAAAVIRTDSSNLVVSCRQPVVRLQAEVVQAGRPFIVALGDPRVALRDLLQQPGASFADAARAVASSCAAMHTLTAAPGALVLSGDNGSDPTRLTERIAQHFALNVSREEIAAIVESLAEAAFDPVPTRGEEWWERLGEREQAIVDGAIQPYVAHFVSGEDLEPLAWERELFFIHEDPPAEPPVPAIRPVDVTGRARILLYGPDVSLPPGSWSANVVLGFSAETAGMSFTVEVFAGRPLCITQLRPAVAQVLEANLHFTIENTVEQQVEIRVISERPAFDGRLALGQVTLTPQATVHGETEQYLAQVLRQ
jgi:hypothetical protein